MAQLSPVQTDNAAQGCHRDAKRRMPHLVGWLAEASVQLVSEHSQVRAQARELFEDLRRWQVRAALADSAWLVVGLRTGIESVTAAQ